MSYFVASNVLINNELALIIHRSSFHEIPNLVARLKEIVARLLLGAAVKDASVLYFRVIGVDYFCNRVAHGLAIRFCEELSYDQEPIGPKLINLGNPVYKTLQIYQSGVNNGPETVTRKLLCQASKRVVYRTKAERGKVVSL